MHAEPGHVEMFNLSPHVIFLLITPSGNNNPGLWSTQPFCLATGRPSWSPASPLYNAIDFTASTWCATCFIPLTTQSLTTSSSTSSCPPCSFTVRRPLQCLSPVAPWNAILTSYSVYITCIMGDYIGNPQHTSSIYAIAVLFPSSSLSSDVSAHRPSSHLSPLYKVGVALYISFFWVVVLWIQINFRNIVFSRRGCSSLANAYWARLADSFRILVLMETKNNYICSFIIFSAHQRCGPF